MKLEKVVFVVKKTPLEKLLEVHSTVSQVKFFLESRGESFEDYKNQSETYKMSLFKIRKSLPANINQQLIEKEQLANFEPDRKSIIVPIGDPGLIINCAKYMQAQPIVALNPDPQRFADVFTSCSNTQFPALVERLFQGEIDTTPITMAKATLDDGQSLYAVNDLFIGRRTHVSARYKIEFAEEEENQSSSGIIVATGAGSTGWLTSVYTSAYSLSRAEKKDRRNVSIPWEADYLSFVVREAFPSKTTKTNILSGLVTKNSSLKITSHMLDDGVIFSDGIEQDHILFPAGTTVTIAPAERKFNLVRYQK